MPMPIGAPVRIEATLSNVYNLASA